MLEIPLPIIPLGSLLERDILLGGKLFLVFCLGVMIQFPAVLVDQSRYLFKTFEAGDRIHRQSLILKNPQK